MAMTELQMPSIRTDFYRTLRSRASELYDVMGRLEKMAEFLNLMDAATLDTMGVPASGSDNGLRQDLLNLRTTCNEVVAFYDGTGTTRTNVPKTVINKIRDI